MTPSALADELDRIAKQLDEADREIVELAAQYIRGATFLRSLSRTYMQEAHLRRRAPKGS